MVPTVEGEAMTARRQPTGWYPDPSGAPVRAEAAPQPKDDPFYSYTGDKPLPDIDAGTVLASRSIPYHILGLPTPLTTTQLLYRSTSQTGNPTVNVTSVIQPPDQDDKTKVISYQSAYDSLNQNDEPSYEISGGVPRLGGLVAGVEAAVFGPFLADGYTVIVPDTEGQRADFAAVAGSVRGLIRLGRDALARAGDHHTGGITAGSRWRCGSAGGAGRDRQAGSGADRPRFRVARASAAAAAGAAGAGP
jgi:hypothetical protein